MVCDHSQTRQVTPCLVILLPWFPHPAHTPHRVWDGTITQAWTHYTSLHVWTPWSDRPGKTGYHCDGRGKELSCDPRPGLQRSPGKVKTQQRRQTISSGASIDSGRCLAIETRVRIGVLYRDKGQGKRWEQNFCMSRLKYHTFLLSLSKPLYPDLDSPLIDDPKAVRKENLEPELWCLCRKGR